MDGDSNSFESFRADVFLRVQYINARLGDPEATWSGVLFLDVPGQPLDLSLYRLAGLSELNKRRLALRLLPERIRSVGARRFCWLMPGWRGRADSLREVATSPTAAVQIVTRRAEIARRLDVVACSRGLAARAAG